MATDMGKGGTETGYERLGERKLTLTDAVAKSAGYMAPVFSSAQLIALIAGPFLSMASIRS